MKQKLLRCLQLVGCTLLVLTLPGCWDYEKINERAQVIGIAVDPAAGSADRFRYTFQIPKFGSGDTSEPSQAGSGPSDAGRSPKFQNYTTEADGLIDALSKVQLENDKMFYLSDVEIILVPEKLGREAVRTLVAECMRIPALDKEAFFAVTTCPAYEMFQGGDGDKAPADEMEHWLGGTMRQVAYSPRVHLWQFWRDLRTPGIDAHTEVVHKVPNGYRIGGMMLYRFGVPKLQIPPSESLYFNMLTIGVNHVGVPIPSKPHSFILGNIATSGRHWTTLKGGQATLHARVEIKGKLDRSPGGREESLTAADLARLQNTASAYFQQQLADTMEQTQRIGSDPYGFGEWLVDDHPELEGLIRVKWPILYEKAKRDIRVRVKITQKGTLV
ncbi:Ger(x)C family spore germination C-terminal domain-containing protein [Alicyclobacillus sp. SP_1]|uniref:Ger(x)C family spore germination protein n=1 Tax=Alicyclobacillus sp. SP_1 TaxID=2942475 RepID=UPI002157A9C3|nr:Ger(x)C family spore germination C-terminal domain-containing protein [Alicyclobacillus sp. SP_1]